MNFNVNTNLVNQLPLDTDYINVNSSPSSSSEGWKYFDGMWSAYSFYGDSVNIGNVRLYINGELKTDLALLIGKDDGRLHYGFVTRVGIKDDTPTSFVVELCRCNIKAV